ncbi:hypothetical protein F5B19DRAFT_463243 [Rostrohypoxylon terebratum]|nr:hypothetical protein F5B19DRAFT_463243 [Rostrohypoxylon terebratum]
MSDQDSKPVEGVKTPVETPDVEATATDIPMSDITDIKKEAEAEATVENGEVAKDDDDDQGITQDAPEANDNNDDNGDNEDESIGVTQSNGNGEVEKPKQRVWPSTRFPPKGMLKVNRGGCPTRERSDPSILPESDDHKAIRWQVEFYFSDSNLPSDKFLWNKTGGSDNKPVPLSVICNFSRMRRFKPHSAVVEALKASERLVLEGPEGDETVRRKEPCVPSDELTNKIEDRTTYIKGFGEESKSTQFDIEDYVSQFGEINAVRLRRDEQAPDKVFKGSVFVEWVDEDTANKFYDLDPEPRYKDHPLMIMPKREYDRQKKEIDDKRKLGMPKKRWNQRDEKRPRFNRPKFDPDNWKKRREDDQREGFNDRRDRPDRGSDRGRGRGRGNGRGRGRGRDRGRNGNDREKEQEPVPQDDGKPKIHTSKEGQKIMKEEKEKRDADIKANGKRGRDDDSTTDAPPSKKVDTKEPIANVA